MPETSLALSSITLLPLVRYPNPEPFLSLSKPLFLIGYSTLAMVHQMATMEAYSECVSSCSRTSVRCGQHSHGEIALLRNTGPLSYGGKDVAVKCVFVSKKPRARAEPQTRPCRKIKDRKQNQSRN